MFNLRASNAFSSMTARNFAAASGVLVAVNMPTLFGVVPGGGSVCADEVDVDLMALVHFLMLFAVEVVIVVLCGDCSLRLLIIFYLVGAKDAYRLCL